MSVADLSVAAASPKLVKKVEFDTEEISQVKGKRRGSSKDVAAGDKLRLDNVDTGDSNDRDLCVECEPGTTDL